MDFDETDYTDIIAIAGAEHEALRNLSKGEVLIPYTEEPDVGIGDVICQKAGKREIFLKVIDVSFLKGGSLNIGTDHPHMLTLKVQNTTAQPHLPQSNSSTFNIGSVSGNNVQVGNGNSLSVNITLKELTEYIAKSENEEAKSKLKDFLSNNTVASVIGAGVAGLLALL